MNTESQDIHLFLINKKQQLNINIGCKTKSIREKYSNRKWQTLQEVHSSRVRRQTTALPCRLPQSFPPRPYKNWSRSLEIRQERWAHWERLWPRWSKRSRGWPTAVDQIQLINGHIQTVLAEVRTLATNLEVNSIAPPNHNSTLSDADPENQVSGDTSQLNVTANVTFDRMNNSIDKLQHTLESNL